MKPRNLCWKSTGRFDEYSNTCTFRYSRRKRTPFNNLETPNPYPAERNCEFHIVCPANHLIQYRVIESDFIPGDIAKIGGSILANQKGQTSTKFQYHTSSTMDIRYVSKIRQSFRGKSGIKMQWKCVRRNSAREIDIV